jgi:phosphoadenosine phosphosulfate reductase
MSQADSVAFNLASRSAQEGLAWVADHFNQVKFSSAFGVEDQVITHLIAAGKLPIKIFTLDTGRLFQETYDLMELTCKKYELTIDVFFPEREDVEEYINENGVNGFFDSVDKRKACCYVRKVRPLGRALADAKVWITGLRGEQSLNRKQMKIVEWDETMNLIKYNPLLDWSDHQLDDYVAHHHIPINALHKKGFASIGCAPCTRAIRPGEDLRAGRWWWESAVKECGLHAVKESRA